MTDGGNSISVLLDENADRQVLAYLRAEDHEGEHVVDALSAGVADHGDIAPYARERGHVVVTKDTDFLAMDEDSHAGVFFIDDHALTAYEIATAIIRLVDAVGDRETLRGVVFVDSWL